MPRTLTSDMIGAMMAERSSFLVLVTLEFDSDEIREMNSGAPLRIVDNAEAVSVSGYVFDPVGFDIQFPDQRSDGSVTRARIKLPNLVDTMVQAIRLSRQQILVTVRVVSETDLDASPPEFDNVEIEFLPMSMRNVRWNDTEIQGDLSFDNLAQLQYPADEMTPFLFPGAF